MCARTYSITIYCGYSLDFIGYFKAFSNAIFNFDSYGVSISFGDDNSKTSVSSIAWFILMILLLQILKLSIVITIINSKTFSDSVAWFESASIVRVYIDWESLFDWESLGVDCESLCGL